MSAVSTIQWTERTWNPVRGCSLVSPGCTNCYAMRQAHRFDHPGGPYEGLTRMTEHGPVWIGKVKLVESELDTPLRWKKPCRVFVNSMSDLFQEDVPTDFLDRVFAVMALAQEHTFQVLTKRPDAAVRYLNQKDPCCLASAAPEKYPCSSFAIEDREWPLPNVWLGTSIESQETADERIPELLNTPAAVRWISYEPALGPVDLKPWLDRCSYYCDHGDMYPEGHRAERSPIDWVVVGGESGPQARPCNVEWIRSIVRQCQAASVPVFVKQVGSVPYDPECNHPSMDGVRGTEQTYFCNICFEEPHPDDLRPCEGAGLIGLRDRKGGDLAEWPEDLRVREYPKA